MRLRRKTQRRKKLKRKTLKRHIGGNQLMIRYDNVPIQGQLLEKKSTVSAPSVEFQKTGKLYTLIMWDPDVPPQIQPGFLHWLVTNLESQNEIMDNQVLDYKGPNPPSGIHRYFFGLFEQDGHITTEQPPRPNFNINEFIKQFNLRLTSNVFMKVASIDA